MGQIRELRFSEGYFHALTTAPSQDFKEWEQVGPLHFRTSSLKLATTYRSRADAVCEKVFDRAFNREVAMPTIRTDLREILDPKQIDGVRWVLSRRRSYLAHAPGAGKTIQAIVAACLTPGQGQNVFIVQPGLERHWEREILKFSHRFVGFPRIGVVGRTNNQRAVAWRADFLIVPDSMLAKPWVYERLSKMKIKLLAVDEASRLKDSGTKRAIAFFGGKIKLGPLTYQTYRGLFHGAERVVLLDGSPMPNRPMELWAPLYALDPEAIDCMSQQDFGFRFCGARQNDRGNWEFKHSSHEAELHERLRRRFMHVVTEEELDHPERRRSLLLMNQDVRSPEMKAWERKNLALLNTICADAEGLSDDLSQGELAVARRELGARKVPWIAKYILGRLGDKNERILLFAWHREVCEMLAQAIGAKVGSGNVGLVMGGTPNQVREDLFARFQAGKLPIIVGNIAAMGRGHNLQKADRVVFAEPSWSDELNRQCEKRASRRGRDKELFVRCEYIVVPDSFDERIMTTLFTKQQRVKRIIG